MYTRCPQCSTIFRVTAAQLRIALGEVSCGSCHKTFNALTALTEDLPELTEVVVRSPADEDPNDAVDADAGAAEPCEGGDASSPHEDDANDGAAAATTDAAAAVGAAATAAREPDASSTEPRYDDDTGCDEILIEVGWQEERAQPADSWARILTDVDGEHAAERVEPEAEAGATGERALEPAGPVEPAYDDNTGVGEILGEDEIEQPGGEDRPAIESEGDELEFNAPEQTWSEIFVVNPASAAIDRPAEVRSDDARADEADREADEATATSSLSSLEIETSDAAEWASFLPSLAPDDVPDEEPSDDTEDDDGPIIVLGTEAEAAAPVAAEKVLATGADDVPVARFPRAEPQMNFDPDFVPPWEGQPDESENRAVRRSRSSVRYIGLAAALVLALGIQLIHYNRDALAAHASWGPRIRAVYAALDLPLYPDWSLDSYRVSGSEAVAGRTAAGALDVMAKVVVAGDRPVGMPMIRIALSDRWGNPVASRVFSAQEYLREFESWPPLLLPGTTIPVEISVADPGSDAHNYVVDVCLPRRQPGLRCQLDVDPFQR